MDGNALTCELFLILCIAENRLYISGELIIQRLDRLQIHIENSFICDSLIVKLHLESLGGVYDTVDCVEGHKPLLLHLL